MQHIVILGGSGDGMVALEGLRQMQAMGLPVRPVGFLNDAMPKGDMLAELPVLGRLDDWTALPEHMLLLPALHKLKAMPQRTRRLAGLQVPAHRWASLIHPTAVVAAGSGPGPGSYVGPYVVIQPGARLGAFLSLRAGANVGHDCELGDFVYMGPNSVLCGRAVLERGVHLGPGAVITDEIRVGEFSVVGAASAVSRQLPSAVLAMGNPARIIEHIPHQDDFS